MLTKYTLKYIAWIILSITAFTFITTVSAEETQVSARVWVINNKPEIVSITPSFSPIVLGQNTVQSFSLQIKDLEWDNISYTITPDVGATSPISGNITNVDRLQNSNAFINFSYLSTNKSSENGASQITVTLNDGINDIVIKEIDLYIF